MPDTDVEEYETDEIDITAFDWINERVTEEVVILLYMRGSDRTN
jgi:hypothetical protein